MLREAWESIFIAANSANTSLPPGVGCQDRAEQVQVKAQGDEEYQAPPAPRGAEQSDDDGDPNCQQQTDRQRRFPVPQVPAHCCPTLRPTGPSRPFGTPEVPKLSDLRARGYGRADRLGAILRRSRARPESPGQRAGSDRRGSSNRQRFLPGPPQWRTGRPKRHRRALSDTTRLNWSRCGRSVICITPLRSVATDHSSPRHPGGSVAHLPAALSRHRSGVEGVSP